MSLAFAEYTLARSISRQCNRGALLSPSAVVLGTGSAENLNPSTVPVPEMRRLRARLVVGSKLLVTFSSTEIHAPLLLGRLGSNDDFVGVGPCLVSVQEFKDPVVGVIGLFKYSFDGEIRLYGLRVSKGWSGRRVSSAPSWCAPRGEAFWCSSNKVELPQQCRREPSSCEYTRY